VRTAGGNRRKLRSSSISVPRGNRGIPGGWIGGSKGRGEAGRRKRQVRSVLGEFCSAERVGKSVKLKKNDKNGKRRRSSGCGTSLKPFNTRGGVVPTKWPQLEGKGLLVVKTNGAWWARNFSRPATRKPWSAVPTLRAMSSASVDKNGGFHERHKGVTVEEKVTVDADRVSKSGGLLRPFRKGGGGL